jgi:predicted DNA-binding protein
MEDAVQQTGFRLPTELIERLDAHAERMRKRAAGVRVTRSDAVRVLLTRALGDAERER